MFNLNTYNRLLAAKRLGRELIELEEVDSTNTWIAKRLGRDGIEKVVVVANRQTAGRGRRGRVWLHHPELNLAFSLAIPMPKETSLNGVITLAAGVSLAEAIGEVSNVTPELKYPNDLILNGKKAAGILTEIKKCGEKSFAVVGVGVNVNLSAESIHESVKEIATSIRIANGSEVSKEAILALFLNRFEDLLDRLETSGTRSVVEKYKKLANTLGRKIQITGAGESFTGVAIDVDMEGGLMVEVGPGDIRRVTSGETIFSD